MNVVFELPPGEAGSKPHSPRVAAKGMLRSESPQAGEGPNLPFRAPGSAQISLQAGQVWTLEATSDGFWIEPVIVVPEQVEGPIRIVLWPAGSVSAQLQTAEGEVPTRARLRLLRRSDPDDARRSVGRSFALDCPADEKGRVLCSVPAGSLDLQVRAPGSVPHYFWNLDLAVGESRDLGKLALRPGASIFGRVELSGPDAEQDSLAEVRVSLVPNRATMTSDTPEGKAERVRRNLRAVSTQTDLHGRFQLAGAPTGVHQLLVEKEGYAPHRIPDLEVFPGAENRLREPVRLSPPIDLEILVDPATAPDGTPWDLRLYDGASREKRAAGIVAPTGAYLAPALGEGEYLVEIGVDDPRPGHRNQRWYFDRSYVDAWTSPLVIEIPVVPFAGRIRRGEDGLAAEIWLGTRHGQQAMAFRSEENGEFEGFLPRDGRWQVEVALLDDSDSNPALPLAYRRLEPVDVHTVGGIASIELELPANRLAGRVIDTEGQPVAGAAILLSNVEHPGKDMETLSGDEGRFELEGLRPGLAHARASAAEGNSSWQAVMIPERGTAAPIELLVRPEHSLRVVLLSETGPVPGARILLVPEAPGRPVTVESYVTDGSGAFLAQVPADVAMVQTFVFSPSHGLFLRRLQARSRADEAPIELRIATRETGDLYLRLADRPLRSFVFFLDGHPLSGGVLADWLALQPTDFARSGHEIGPVHVPRVQAGSWALCPARAFDRSSGEALAPSAACATGLLPPFGSLELGPFPAGP